MSALPLTPGEPGPPGRSAEARPPASGVNGSGINVHGVNGHGPPSAPGRVGRRRRESPVDRFLGASADESDPLRLLGLRDREVLDQAAVALALRERLATIDRHPEARTPGADEARMALHAAAATLGAAIAATPWAFRRAGRPAAGGAPGDDDASGDRSTHQHPDQHEDQHPDRHAHQPVDSAGELFPPGLHGAGPEHDGPLTDPALRSLVEDARAVIAAHGGWSARAARHVAMIAHSRGLPATAVPEALAAIEAAAPHAPAASWPVVLPAPVVLHETVAAPRAPWAPSASSVPTASVPRHHGPAQRPGPDRTAAVAIALGLVTIVAIISAAALLVIRSTGRDDPGLPLDRSQAGGSVPKPSPGLTSAAGAAATAASERTPVSRSERNLSDPGALLREFQAVALAVRMSSGDGGGTLIWEGSVVRFAELADRLASGWAALEPDAHAAMQASIADAARSAADPAASAGLIEAVAATAPESAGDTGAVSISRAIWAAGTLVRLRGERELTGESLRRIDEALARRGVAGAVGFTFDRGAAEAAVRLGERLATGQPPAGLGPWREWVTCVLALDRATDRRPGAPRDLLILGALDRLIRRPFDPAQGVETAGVIGLLAGSITWSEGSASRGWLLAAFDDSGVSTPALAALTGALTTRTGLAGVTAAMALGPGASDLDRRRLRDRYAGLWMLDGGPMGATPLESAAEAIDAAPWPSGQTGHLARAAAMATWNAGAALAWRNDPDAGALLIDLTAAPLALAAAASGRTAHPLGDAAAQRPPWARDYLDAGQNIPVRQALLEQLAQRSGRLAVVEAEALVVEAVRGSPKPIRDRARELARRFADDPAVVNGFLEQADRIPRTRENAELLAVVTRSAIPAADSPLWEAEVPRALASRLLDLIAADGPLRAIDGLAAMIADAYAAASGQGRSSGPASPEALPGYARSIADRWAQSLGALAPPPEPELSPDAIDRRRVARLSVAEGPIQRFNAEQLALVETMAAVISAESPASAARAVELYRSLVDSRRRAADIFEQIAEAEHAALELWRLRFEGANR